MLKIVTCFILSHTTLSGKVKTVVVFAVILSLWRNMWREHNIGSSNMRNRFLTVAVAAVAFALSLGLSVSPVQAQQACGERAKFMAKLKETFAEEPIAMGLTDKGAVLEVFASQTGSWTFLITMPNGLTCVVASGQSWETLPIKSAGQVS